MLIGPALFRSNKKGTMESRVAAETPAPAEPPEKKVRARKPRIPQVAEASEVAEKKVRVRNPRAKPEAKTEAPPAGRPQLPAVDAPCFAALGGTLRNLQRDDRQAKLSSLRIA